MFVPLAAPPAGRMVETCAACGGVLAADVDATDGHWDAPVPKQLPGGDG